MNKEKRRLMWFLVGVVAMWILLIPFICRADILIDDWEDANKSGSNNLCWVATAANMLAYGGWADDAQVTFDLLSTQVDNKNNYPITAIELFSEYEPELDVDFYFREYHTNSDIKTSVENIEKYLNEGCAVSVLIVDSTATSWRHYYTIWGVETDGDDYIGLYFTDSNDGVVMLDYDTLSRAYWKQMDINVWMLGDRYYLIDVDTLQPRPGSIDPDNPSDPPDSSISGCFISTVE